MLLFQGKLVVFDGSMAIERPEQTCASIEFLRP